jgi:hypothetical protein
MSRPVKYVSALILSGLVVGTTLPAHAELREITVTVTNLAPANSVSFAPLRFGFNNGSFDAFNIGQIANAATISIAEGGSGSAWFPAFAAADPTAVLGSTMGALTPGASFITRSFLVDTTLNPFFTFASMVLPSNDFFIGNDDPMEYRLFDAAGNLLINNIDQAADEIWNAGSEAFDPANAAFVVGGNNGARTPENGVVEFNFAELARFNGLTTAAGYTFNSNLQANTAVYRISFASVAAVPEAATWAQMITGFMIVGGVLRRRKQVQSSLRVV